MNNTIKTKEELLKSIEKYKNTCFFDAITAVLDESSIYLLREQDVRFINGLISHKHFSKDFKEIDNIFKECKMNNSMNETTRQNFLIFQYLLSNVFINSYSKQIESFNFNKKTNLIKVKGSVKEGKKKRIEDFCHNQVFKTVENFFACFGEHIKDSKISSILKDEDNLDTIFSYITKTILNNKVKENEFINFINKTKKSSKENESLLTYISSYSLSKFINTIFKFINKISYKETIFIDGKDRNKRIRFLEDFKDFLKSNLINGKQLFESYKHSSYVYFITDDEMNEKMGFKSSEHEMSHYVQGAYLKKIIGNQSFTFDRGQPINLSKTSFENPYCKYYFYKEALVGTKDKKIIDNIEKKLSIIEGEFVNSEKRKSYLEHLKDAMFFLDKNDKFNSFYNKNISFFQETKLIFLLNYIRTPLFLENLVESYYKYNMNHEKCFLDAFKSGNVYSFKYHIMWDVFKSVQYGLIEYFIDFIENKNDFANLESIPEEIINSCGKHFKDIDLGKFMSEGLNANYIGLVIHKLLHFILTDEYCFKTKNIEPKYFTNSLFIPKIINKNNLLFENKHLLELAYFPISSNEIFIIYYPSEHVKNFIENMNSDCMIDLSYVPFLISKDKF